MDNLEKLAIQGTQDKEKQTKTQHNICWTPLYANKNTNNVNKTLGLLQTTFMRVMVQ